MSAALESLVSGLYGQRRGQRLLFMLQAFIDESVDDSVLSMGGYVSTYEKWEAFEKEWQSALQRQPRIEYFKFSDCFKINGEYRKDGQFRGISEDDALEKVADLYKIIGDHALAYVSCAVDPSLYRKMFRRFPKPISSPYHCLLKILTWLPKALLDSGLEGSVNFVFDRQVMEEKSILDAWYSFEEQGLIDRSLIRSASMFMDDRDSVPLQAADMLAGRMRHSLRNEFGIVPPPFMPMRLGQKSIPGHHYIATETDISRLSAFMDLHLRTTITGRLGYQPFISVDLSALKLGNL